MNEWNGSKKNQHLMWKKCDIFELSDATTRKEKFLTLDWNQLWMRNKVEKQGNDMKKFIWQIKRWINGLEARIWTFEWKKSHIFKISAAVSKMDVQNGPQKSKEKFLILEWNQLWSWNKAQKIVNGLKKFIWEVRNKMDELQARKFKIEWKKIETFENKINVCSWK